MRVLSVQGLESEGDLPFAGLSELCAGELDRVGSLLETTSRKTDRRAQALRLAMTD